MAETLAAQLDRVQSAIAAIEAGGQSVRFPDGTEYTRANVQTLYERETSLLSRINQAARGGLNYMPVGFGRPQ